MPPKEWIGYVTKMGCFELNKNKCEKISECRIICNNQKKPYKIASIFNSLSGYPKALRNILTLLFLYQIILKDVLFIMYK